MPKELPTKYNPSEIEDDIYQFWQDKKYFHAKIDKKAKPFTIVIPPPNVTGQLHMGHALDETIQDILIRYKRMQGFCALWVPGTDHAGIATQIKVEEVLKKEEGKTRHDLGREAFLEKVWEWKKLYGNRITSQLKKLGSSCDWDRERFTMDEGCSKAVREVFVDFYEKGLIYKGNRIINWCPSCNTALSDAEVEYSEQDGKLWYIKYQLENSDDFITIATTRPETMLGDTAIAVNPNDERYKNLVGKYAILPLLNRKIEIIADDYVEPSFGTGCVKITPCHDPNDFEIGNRHNLEKILVIDGNGKINKNGGIYAGLDRIEARARIIEDLDKLSLLVKIEEIKHNVGKCYRCKNTIEPLTSSQWFVKMEELAKPAIDVVKKGEINFVPERFSKTYLNWMENVHDWCISRQLWWGHRIPAFYCDDCDTMTVSKKDIKVCPHCGSKKIHQDEDVLDTWFSSALWPFSTLGFPDKTEDLKYFYPTSVLVTGYDIIFFWVARMIFSGLHHMKEIPFKTVFLHGIVRDDQGRKMSKSLGNGIDPLEIIDEYGADALRFTLATGNSPGNDMRFYKERVEASGNFANKLWNAARFTLMNVTIDKITVPITSELHIEDRWILSKLNTLILEYTENLDKYEIGIAAAKLYDFTWEIFCDWYIELLKPRLYNKEDIKSNISAQNTICYVLMNILKLLHPIMPFITEEIWQCLPVVTESIMISKFPTYNKEYYSKEIEIDMERVMGAIRNIRAIRTQMNVLPSKKTKLFIETSHRKLFNDVAPFFEKLAFASETSISESFLIKNAVTVICDGAKIFIPLEELVDVKEEIARLTLEVAKFDSEILRIEKKLSNEGFISKAPANVIDEEKAKLEKYTQMKNDSVTALNKYNKLQSN